jgi:membrane protein YqaA with SNARE-associated domain
VYINTPFFILNILLEFLIPYGYLGLFIASFLAATILPFSSEVVLVSLLSFSYKEFNYSSILLIASATLGNFLGGTTNYYLGRFCKIEWLNKYLGFSEQKLQKASKYVHKYGAYLAFFSWIPIVGDPMCIALGWFKAKQARFLLFMFVGKLMRYVILGFIFYKTIN